MLKSGGRAATSSDQAVVQQAARKKAGCVFMAALLALHPSASPALPIC